MKIIIAILAISLTGCAAKVVSSSARTVVISAPDAAIAESQKLADIECAKSKRFARLIKQPTPYSTEFVYDCVE